MALNTITLIQITKDMQFIKEKKKLIFKQELQYVSIEKFESVCHELNNALRREQQAQQLLIEQGRQLEEITMRLDLYTTEGMEKEQTLTEAVHVSRTFIIKSTEINKGNIVKNHYICLQFLLIFIGHIKSVQYSIN